MPNLENMKKQAKQYLRWHRERHYPVADIIRTTLPRFGHLADREVLDAPFSLADAQELVARQNGFDRWTALKTGAQDMSKPTGPISERPYLSGTEAILYVTDFTRSRTFFTEQLGFTADFAYGDPPFYGAIHRDNARLFLRLISEPVFVGDIRQREELLSAAITLDSATDIKQLFLDYKAAGIAFHQTLKTQPGAQELLSCSIQTRI